MLDFTLGSTLTVLVLCCWFGTIIGLPGNWLMLVLAAGLAAFVSSESYLYVPWWAVGVLFALAVLGEVFEFVAGALGVGKLGGSKRAAALAMIGSVIGAVVGLFVGIPVPVIGSLIASLLFGGLGAGIGAVIGEHWKGKDLEPSLNVGVAAFIGKVIGTVGKGLFGGAMACLMLIVIWSPI
jgi:uncharacterized protein